MDRIVKVPGNKLTKKQLDIVRAMYTLLHRDQLQYSQQPEQNQQAHIQKNMKWFSNPKRTVHFYNRDNTPIGMLATSPDRVSSQAQYIGSLYVNPKYRGQGIGTKLLDSAQEQARKKKLKALVLMYYGANPAANLYSRYGFKPYQVTGVKKLASKSITFPQEQIQALRQRLANYSPIWTTRVSKDRTAYNKGDVLQNQLIAEPLYVSQARDISSLQKHPFEKFLTPEQKQLLNKYKKMRVLKLKPYSWRDNPIYNQTMGTQGKRYKIAKLIRAIKQHKLKPQTINIQDIGTLNQKLDNTWGNAIYKQAPQLTIKQFAQNHLPRIINADLKYPILVSQDKKYVYDGLHRLMKTMLQNKKKIKAYRVPHSYLKQVQEFAQNQGE